MSLAIAFPPLTPDLVEKVAGVELENLPVDDALRIHADRAGARWLSEAMTNCCVSVIARRFASTAPVDAAHLARAVFEDVARMHGITTIESVLIFVDPENAVHQAASRLARDVLSPAWSIAAADVLHGLIGLLQGPSVPEAMCVSADVRMHHLGDRAVHASTFLWTDGRNVLALFTAARHL